MNKLHFIFTELDSKKSITELANIFNTTASNDLIRIPASDGTGIIRKNHLDPGLSMRIWNFCLNKAISFHKLAHHDLREEKSFHIVYFLDTDCLNLTNKTSRKSLKLSYDKNIIFFSGDTEIDFEIAAGNGFYAIDLSISYSWLAEAFSDCDTTIQSFINNLNQKERPTILFDSSLPEEYRIISDICSAAGLKTTLRVRATAMLLVADFFTRVSIQSFKKEITEGNTLYYKRIIRAEEMLKENVLGIFPGLAIISKAVTLSESTLKRYFRIVFQKSLYEYYLEIKMEYAKQLMLENPLTVSEVASLLKYEKVSSFIETFKKHHGYSPGHLKRRYE